MRIPEIRDELTEKAKRLRAMARDLIAQASAIDLYVQELHRRPAVRRAPQTRRYMTANLKQSIKAYAAANPKASYGAIGVHFNVGEGRVSEVLAGKRT